MLAKRPVQPAPIAVDNLRATSPRPTIVVDERSRPLGDSIGLPQPLGRERVVFALPLDPGPAVLRASVVDFAGLTKHPVWVSRMMTARWVEDTRRLGG